MKNAKGFARRQVGQIAIITLFSLAIFVVVGGSIVTQIIFEQRKAVLEQKSKEAYYAAESGIENALQEILAGGSVTETLKIGNADVGVSAQETTENTTYLVPTLLFPGQSYYLNLEGYTASDQLRVCWDKAGASLLTMLFYDTAVGNPSSYTQALNSLGSTNIVGGASSGTTAGGCGLAGTVYFYDLNFPAGTYSHLVVWAAYQDAIQVAFEALGAETIPSQGTVVVSTAAIEENSSDNIVREVKYFVSQVSGNNLVYPPYYLLAPVYAVGGVNFSTQ